MMEFKKAARKAKYYTNAFVPAKVLQSRLHKHVFMQFAEKIGLVYFGYVDQRNDEHRLVRGLTVSASHRDNHYCIGSFKGYDVTLVERTDTIHFPGKSPRTQDWIIMVFDLHTTVDLPHVFVGLHTHSDTFYAQLFIKFATLAKVPLGTFSSYAPGFIDRYAIYTDPAQTVVTERLFDDNIAKAMVDHFGGLTAEIADGCLYIYASHQRPTISMLTKMLQNGVWLAQSLDARSYQL
jgi:hypothetical protein